MEITFAAWLQRSPSGSAYDQKCSHERLRTDERCGVPISWEHCFTLCQMHALAAKDLAFPVLGNEGDYREYYVKTMTDAENAASHGLLPRQRSVVVSAFALLFQRYLTVLD